MKLCVIWRRFEVDKEKYLFRSPRYFRHEASNLLIIGSSKLTSSWRTCREEKKMVAKNRERTFKCVYLSYYTMPALSFLLSPFVINTGIYSYLLTEMFIIQCRSILLFKRSISQSFNIYLSLPYPRSPFLRLSIAFFPAVLIAY